MEGTATAFVHLSIVDLVQIGEYAGICGEYPAVRHFHTEHGLGKILQACGFLHINELQVIRIIRALLIGSQQIVQLAFHLQG